MTMHTFIINLVGIFFVLLPITIVTSTNDTCTALPDAGNCLAAFQRFYYNTTSFQCESFIYGGCNGNSNNYNTIQECQSNCDICFLPPLIGPCRANFHRYFYNSARNTCQNFTWGGCGGNANRFDTIDQCQKRCPTSKSVNKTSTPSCTAPKDSGPCNAIFNRWYYNTSTSTCQRFIYGGCDGNGNNYITIDECSMECYKDFNDTNDTPTKAPTPIVCPRGLLGRLRLWIYSQFADCFDGEHLVPCYELFADCFDGEHLVPCYKLYDDHS